MQILIVNFNLDGLSEEEFASACDELAPAFAAVPGLASKVWLADRADKLVDEIPSAYKDIDQVMADQADLVEVRHTLHQVLNYKGT